MKVIALIVLCVASALAVPSGYGYEAPIIKVAAPAVYSSYETPIIRASSYESPALKKFVPILKQTMINDNMGTFNLDSQTGDGITVSEAGTLKNLGDKEGPVQVKTGSYSYTAPDGQLLTVTWTADENGFRASGAHLPTPPPVPEEILKSLALPRIPEYQASAYAAPALKPDTGYYSAPAPVVRVQSYGY